MFLGLGLCFTVLRGGFAWCCIVVFGGGLRLLLVWGLVMLFGLLGGLVAGCLVCDFVFVLICSGLLIVLGWFAYSAASGCVMV